MDWFRNLKLARKLSVVLAVLITGMILKTGYSVVLFHRSNETTREIVQNWLFGIQRSSEMVESLNRFRLTAFEATVATGAERDAMLARSESELGTFQEAAAAYEPTILTEHEREIFETARDAGVTYMTNSPAIALIRAGREDESRVMMAQRASRFAEVLGAVQALKQFNVDGANAAADRAAAQYASSSVLIPVVVASLIVFAIVVFSMLGRSITSALKANQDVLQAVAEGDYTKRVSLDTTDELGSMGTTLNQAVQAVQDAFLEVREISEALASASRQLAAASESISAGAQEQASSLEETAANIEEITGTVRRNSDNAQQAAQLAQASRQTAERGGSVVNSAVGAMGEIHKSSRSIAEIIDTIDEIAFQTNLLALNAAVEAARAGEQGRGFAVVAGEVRNLAQRASASSKEIKDLIQDSSRKVEEGSSLVNQSGSQLQEINTSVKRVTDIVGEMAMAFREQTSGLEQINQAVTQMDQVTQQNAAQTEELTGTSEALAQQAEQLREVVARFKLGNAPAPVARVERAHPTVTRAAPAPRVARARTVSRSVPRPRAIAKAEAANDTHYDAMDKAMAAGAEGFEEI